MRGALPAALDALLARKRELATAAAASPEFASRLRELRAWQAERLARTYRDLHRDPRCAPAVEFFLTDLYGAKDFTARDQEVARAWRYLKHSLPAIALETLARAIELEVLTAELDQALAGVLQPGPIDETTYARAYRAAGHRQARQRQIQLVLDAGRSLAGSVRQPWVGGLLRAAHGPAHVAGLGVLQDFLERGYEAFRRMGSEQQLLDAIRERETALMDSLLSGASNPFAHE